MKSNEFESLFKELESLCKKHKVTAFLSDSTNGQVLINFWEQETPNRTHLRKRTYEFSYASNWAGSPKKKLVAKEIIERKLKI